MFHRPPLLEEPCAQTLSGINAAGWSHSLTVFKADTVYAEVKRPEAKNTRGT